MKTVAQKMGIKDNCRAIFINAPDGVVDLLELPKVVIEKKLNDAFDLIHYFATNQSLLKENFLLLKSHLKPNGMLWISWAKAGQLETDLNLKKIINIGYSFGLVESTTISVNHIWSAIKFTHPKKNKIYNNSYGVLNNLGV